MDTKLLPVAFSLLLLACTALLSSCALAFPTFEAKPKLWIPFEEEAATGASHFYGREPGQREERSHHHPTTDGTGGMTRARLQHRSPLFDAQLNYEADIRPGVWWLERNPSVVAVECLEDGQSVALFVSSINDTLHFTTPGAMLVSSSRFYCLDQRGLPEPLHRKVLSASVEAEQSMLVIKTKKIDFLECFYSLKLKFSFLPRHKATTNSSMTTAKREAIETLLEGSVNYDSNRDEAIEKFELLQLGEMEEGQQSTYGVEVVCEDCYLKYSLGATLEVDYQWSVWGGNPLRKFIGTVIGNVDVLAELSLHAQASFSAKTQKPLLGLRQVSPPGWGVTIMGITVGITASLGLDGAASVEFEGVVQATSGFRADCEIEYGFSYFAGEEPKELQRISWDVDQLPIGIDAEYTAEIKLALIPVLQVEFGVVVANLGFRVEPTPWFGIRLEDQLDCFLHYQTFLEFDLTGKFLPIEIASWALTEEKAMTVNLVSDYNIPCSFCSGCLDELVLSTFLSWIPGEWSECSQPCNGIQTRTLTCFNGTHQAIDSALCNGLELLSTSRECHFPGEICSEQMDPCSSFDSCATCLAASCRWCPSSQTCRWSTRGTDQFGDDSCSGGSWLIETCAPPEDPLSMTHPGDGPKGKTMTLLWEGGLSRSAGGQVALRWATGDDEPRVWKAGHGLPELPIANSGSFEWTVDDAFPESTSVRVAIESVSQPTNVFITDAFRIYTVTEEYYWDLGGWSFCISSCGGYQSRAIFCRNRETGASVTDEALCPSPKPPSTQPCTPSSDMSYVCWEGQCVSTSTGYPISNLAWCCYACGDPCVGAEWSYEPTSCNKECGGGQMQYHPTCKKGSMLCDPTFCENGPPGFVENQPPEEKCNTQPCAGWVAEPWQPCSHTCGGGTRTRAVKCEDSLGQEAPLVQCLGEPKLDDEEPCNMHVCSEYSIHITKAGPALVSVGEEVVVEWTGGKDDASVSVELHNNKGETTVLGVRPPRGPRSISWRVPAGTKAVQNGRIVVRSNSDVSNKAEQDGITIRGMAEYLLQLVPYSSSASISSSAVFLVSAMGSFGTLPEQQLSIQEGGRNLSVALPLVGKIFAVQAMVEDEGSEASPWSDGGFLRVVQVTEELGEEEFRFGLESGLEMGVSYLRSNCLQWPKDSVCNNKLACAWQEDACDVKVQYSSASSSASSASSASSSSSSSAASSSSSSASSSPSASSPAASSSSASASSSSSVPESDDSVSRDEDGSSEFGSSSRSFNIPSLYVNLFR